MEGAIRHENPETLPLFPALQAAPAVAEGATSQRDAHASASSVKGSASSLKSGKSAGSKRTRRTRRQADERAHLDPAFSATKLSDQADADDYHMAIAWRLSKAMKGVKTGHRDAKALRDMTPGQKHQVGNVICGHLLASLRAQVAAETDQH